MWQMKIACYIVTGLKPMTLTPLHHISVSVDYSARPSDRLCVCLLLYAYNQLRMHRAEYKE